MVTFFFCVFRSRFGFSHKRGLEIPARHQLETFTSFSTDINAAYQFSGENGCIFKLKYDLAKRHGYIVDVSWISKFPDEKEFLAIRTFTIKINRSKIKWQNVGNRKKVQIVPCECW